ncbi:MAG: hypothetical protein Q4A40_04790 [Bacillota bacterium]|nr:hypothetical protein [Bacillota bacterium]
MRSKRYIIQVVLAVTLAVGLAGCTDTVEDAGTKALHDKGTEVAQTTETKAKETEHAEEIYAKAEDPAGHKPEAKKETAKTQEQKKQENKPAETKAAKPTQQASKPVHTHSWQPVYASKTVTDYKQVCITRCSACGADITGHASEHRKQEALAGNNAGSYETYETVACGSHTEQYVTGYRCSCGATK